MTKLKIKKYFIILTGILISWSCMSSTIQKESIDEALNRADAANTKTLDVNKYFRVVRHISKNNYISKSDTPFETYVYYADGLASRSYSKHTINVKTPDLADGEYFVGYLIDPDGYLEERSIQNNNMVAFKLEIDSDD